MIIMIQIVTISLATFLSLTTSSFIQPRDLVDEAKDQLEQLKNTVRAHIFVAHYDIMNLVSEYEFNKSGTLSNTTITIDNYHSDSVKSQLKAMINLAQAAGYDVASCTDIHEETLDSLPLSYMRSTFSCTEKLNGQAVQAAQDATYLTDTVMNKIHDLENQLNRCKQDVLCITQLLAEIDHYYIRMPQNIKTQMEATESLFTSMTIYVSNCGSSNIADYTAESGAILREIQECIDGIMG